VGQLVVVFSRNRYRVARVVKLAAKRVAVEYTTLGAIDEAWKIAGISHVARLRDEIAHDLEIAARYEKQADLIERLGIEVTEGRSDPFVPLASLPAEYRALDSSRNAARTTMSILPRGSASGPRAAEGAPSIA
jgi:hypothetical protein